MPTTVDFHVFYSGKVQGVGFRYLVKQLATGYEVAGGVRNLADGRVELQVGGEEEEVEAFLEAIVKSQLCTHIEKFEKIPAHPSEKKKGFEIWR